MNKEDGTEWCVDVPRQECSVTTETVKKKTPKTECGVKQTEVCGPEACPIVKGEKMCRNEVRTVSI